MDCSESDPDPDEDSYESSSSSTKRLTHERQRYNQQCNKRVRWNAKYKGMMNGRYRFLDMFPLRFGECFEWHCFSANATSQLVSLLRSTIFASILLVMPAKRQVRNMSAKSSVPRHVS